MIHPKLISAYILLQKPLWYIQQSRNEAFKYIGGLFDFMAILTFLAVKGVQITFGMSLMFAIMLLLSAWLCGWILTITGVVEYNTQLSNKQNPELLEIKEAVKRIEAKLK